MDRRVRNFRKHNNLKKMRYCKYHMTKGCRKSDAQCRYIHDTRIVIPCPYQQCSKGKDCWYNHEERSLNKTSLAAIFEELLDTKLKSFEETIVQRLSEKIEPRKEEVDRENSMSLDNSVSVQNSKMNGEESQNDKITGEDGVQATLNVEGMDTSSPSPPQPKVKESQNEKVTGEGDLANSNDHLEEDMKMDSSQVKHKLEFKFYRDKYGNSSCACPASPCNGRIKLYPIRSRFREYEFQICFYCNEKIDRTHKFFWEHEDKVHVWERAGLERPFPNFRNHGMYMCANTVLFQVKTS